MKWVNLDQAILQVAEGDYEGAEVNLKITWATLKGISQKGCYAISYIPLARMILAQRRFDELEAEVTYFLSDEMIYISALPLLLMFMGDSARGRKDMKKAVEWYEKAAASAKSRKSLGNRSFASLVPNNRGKW